MPSFFKKPAWASKSGAAKSEFYRRSENTYADIVAAEREAHKRSKPPPEAVEETALESDRDVKRVRLSEEVQDEKAEVVDNEESVESNNLEEPERPSESKPAEDTSRKEDELQEMPPGDSLNTHRPDSPLPSPLDDATETKSPVLQESFQESDTGSSDSTPKEIPRPTNPPKAPSPAPPSPQQPPKPDPIVQILITSQIPNTRPLVVHRKMSQSLKEVRLEWMKRQGITPELQPDVYLTWKGRRLFDVTTCRSLGIKVDSNRDSFLDTDDDLDAVPKEVRIHMEAATKNSKLLEQADPSHTEDHAPPAPPSPGEAVNEPMKLILRSNAKEDLRIKARPKTEVSKLISAFREKQSIPADQDVLLLFDGERLDPNACLGDYDIADLDLVDVQVKQRG